MRADSYTSWSSLFEGVSHHLTRMVPLVLVHVIVLCFSTILADNFTAKYPRIAPGPWAKREPRFITFNTGEKGEIEVDLEFAIPFITIPVRKTVDNAWNLMSGEGLANINVGALVIAGGMVLGAVVAVPFLSSLLMKNIFATPGYHRSDGYDNELWRLMTMVDNVLIENNIDTTACMQRTICALVQDAHGRINGGAATSRDKIIDGLVSSEWLNSFIEGSAIHSAIENALQQVNCSHLYNTCKLSNNQLHITQKLFNIP